MAANPEVNARNILAIQDFSKQTRAIARDIQAELKALTIRVESLQIENHALKNQMQTLQVKIFSGGATG